MDRSKLPPAVIEALRSGNKIQAIKLLRETLGGLGLAEAKGILDHLEKGEAAPAPAKPGPKPAVRIVKTVHADPTAPSRDGLSPGEEPRSNSNPISVIGLIVLAMLGLWLFSRYG